MRVKPSLFAALLFALPALATAGDAKKSDAEKEEPIDWVGSYAKAIERGESEDKPIVFKFYTGWCPHCVRMDKTTWLDEGVAELCESFVSAKVNADVEKVPVKRYQLKGYPTVIIAEPGGDQVLRLEGYKNAKQVGAYLKTYLKNEDEIWVELQCDVRIFSPFFAFHLE